MATRREILTKQTAEKNIESFLSNQVMQKNRDLYINMTGDQQKLLQSAIMYGRLLQLSESTI